jgi:hypothetical protein
MPKEVYFDSGMRGWISVTAVDVHRRYGLSRWYEIEDLIQEGFICFCNVWDKYRSLFDVEHPTKQQRGHFMALVKSAFLNRLKNMVKPGTYRRAIEYTPQWEKMLGSTGEFATISLLLSQAPAEIKDMLDRLLSDVELGPYRSYKTKCGLPIRETTREYWTRMLGQPDAVDKLASYFGI